LSVSSGRWALKQGLLHFISILKILFVESIFAPADLSMDFLHLQERKSFDEKFVRIDTEKLCKLASAALGLQLRPLVDLTCGALARIIGGKTPDEVRDIFHLPDDLTEVRVPFIVVYWKKFS
jgi:hypothetical protein